MRSGGSYIVDPETGVERLVARTGPDPTRADAAAIAGAEARLAAAGEPDPSARDVAAEARARETGMPMPVDETGRATRSGAAKKPPIAATPKE